MQYHLFVTEMPDCFLNKQYSVLTEINSIPCKYGNFIEFVFCFVCCHSLNVLLALYLQGEFIVCRDHCFFLTKIALRYILDTSNNIGDCFILALPFLNKKKSN